MLGAAFSLWRLERPYAGPFEKDGVLDSEHYEAHHPNPPQLFHYLTDRSKTLHDRLNSIPY